MYVSIHAHTLTYRGILYSLSAVCWSLWAFQARKSVGHVPWDAGAAPQVPEAQLLLRAQGIQTCSLKQLHFGGCCLELKGSYEGLVRPYTVLLLMDKILHYPL